MRKNHTSYLVTNSYVINEYSITIYDFICLTSLENSPKKDVVSSLDSELHSTDWCCIMNDIAQGLKYAHSQRIIHRDLKANNVVQTATLKPVLIDFGKSLRTPTRMKYELTEKEKQQYHKQHKHNFKSLQEIEILFDKNKRIIHESNIIIF